MPRSLTYSVLCLRVKPSGEANREAWFLSSEEGIFRATVFGGPKSRLRSQVSPFHLGKIWIYHDPVRDSRKVTDFDVTAWHPGLRELYERTIAADSIAETILNTHGGGGAWKNALDLTAGALSCLETSDEKNCERILLHFLWAWAEILGVRPDLEFCNTCACEIPIDKLLWYDQKEGSVRCSDCCTDAEKNENTVSEHGMILNPGARRWLFTAGQLEPREALRFNLDKVSFRQAKGFILAVLTAAIGKRLPLWDHN